MNGLEKLRAELAQAIADPGKNLRILEAEGVEPFDPASYSAGWNAAMLATIDAIDVAYMPRERGTP